MYVNLYFKKKGEKMKIKGIDFYSAANFTRSTQFIGHEGQDIIKVNDHMGVTPYDQSSGVEWGCYPTELGSGCKSQTDGATNTSYILSHCTERPIAASVCADYGDGNWYLPAIDELEILYNNRSNINNIADSNFVSTFYWSSTEFYSYGAYTVSFFNGYTNTIYKDNIYYVRCVRTF